MQDLLAVDEATVQFGGIRAVDTISFRLQRGEILGLIGPNGAGKTTLLNAVTGFAHIQHGSVFMDGTDITTCAPYTRVAMGMGRTFQIEHPFANMTVAENVLVSAFLRYRRRRQAEQLVAHVLEQVGLADRATQLASDLNLARLRRLELAKALAVEPRVLFLDEIMAGLNPPALREMIGFVRSLSERGIGICMVEHIMEAVIALAGRVLVLANGKLIAEGDPRTVVQQEIVIQSYLGKD